jgi:hypothetical protein
MMDLKDSPNQAGISGGYCWNKKQKNSLLAKKKIFIGSALGSIGY